VSHYAPGSETVSVTARGVEYLRTQRQVGIAG